MRVLRRNLQPFYYALYLGRVAVVDEDGNETGEYTHEYGEKTMAYANISYAKGSIGSMWYGLVEDYDKTLVLDKNIPIESSTKLWIDDFDSPDGDYKVRLVRKSLNSNSILARKIRSESGE